MKPILRPLALLTLLLGISAAAQEQPVVLKVGLLLDGSGRVLRNTRIVILGSKILRIDPQAQGATYDLSPLTVLPGWIDVHVHITYRFGPNGQAFEKDEPPEQATLAAAANAYATLLAGFTTVQSIGAPADIHELAEGWMLPHVSPGSELLVDEAENRKQGNCGSCPSQQVE